MSTPVDVANLLVLGIALQRLRTGTLCALHSQRTAAATAARQARPSPAAAERRATESVAPLIASSKLLMAQPLKDRPPEAGCCRLALPPPTLHSCRTYTK